jgi:hypothetical protein
MRLRFRLARRAARGRVIPSGRGGAPQPDAGSPLPGHRLGASLLSVQAPDFGPTLPSLPLPSFWPVLLVLVLALALALLWAARRRGRRRWRGPAVPGPADPGDGGLPLLLIPEREAGEVGAGVAGPGVMRGAARPPWLTRAALGLVAAGTILVATRVLVPSAADTWSGDAGWWAAMRAPVPAGLDVVAEARVEEASRSVAVVDPATGTQLVVWSGDGQAGVPGRPLRRALAVVVRDREDRPVAGAEVRFAVAPGGGRVEPWRVVTGELGLATTTWWLGGEADSLRVRAWLAEPGLQVEFRAAHEEGVVPPRETGRQEVRLAELGPGTAPADTPAATGAAAARPAAAPARPAAEPAVAVRARASFSAGGAHTCQVSGGSAPVCWGGDGGGGAVAGAPRLRSVRSGVFHTCGLTPDGGVFCWPVRSAGGAGPGTLAAPAVELKLPGGVAAVDVVAGAEHSCALGTDGGVYCWGGNAQGQLGNGTTADAGAPVKVDGLPSVVQLAAGWLHTCALARDGRAYCWGANARGQIGDGGTGDRARPVAVAHRGPFTVLAAGSAHSCGLTGAGTAWCWGGNEQGQLGTGGAGGVERRPSRVAGEHAFQALVAGGVHTCGLTAAGRAWCWGGNTFGQLGTGSPGDAPAPVAVADVAALVAIDAGGAHTCAEAADGRVYCWGNNIQGQVGDGTRENRPVPVPTRRQGGP